jgi:hypothetical protein
VRNDGKGAATAHFVQKGAHGEVRISTSGQRAES